MRVVVNTNILFSFFNKKSKAREYATLPSLELYAPSFALEELGEHKEEIMEKFSLSTMQFSLIVKFLHTVVNFVKNEEYASFLSEAKEVSPDPDDIDLFALSFKLHCILWSNDTALKKQSRITVISTKDLVEQYRW